jgi:hypothetical protein
MDRAFSAPVAPSPLHFALVACAPRMIVDTWYDGIVRLALTSTAATDWGEIQGTPRAGVGETSWYRAYDAEGDGVPVDRAQGWKTLLYKPHGAVSPAHHYLVADSDYVEVLTEIDIQTPIPDIVRQSRKDMGFLFLGCRFDDQMLRSYARQILKRSAGAALRHHGRWRINQERRTLLARYADFHSRSAIGGSGLRRLLRLIAGVLPTGFSTRNQYRRRRVF